jgi:hypothetical protein
MVERQTGKVQAIAFRFGEVIAHEIVQDVSMRLADRFGKTSRTR